MKFLLIDVHHNEVKVVEANGLDDYYKHIGCDCIDIVRRKIADLKVNIICDDNGTLVDHPKVSAVNVVGKPCLYGNLLIAGGKVIDGELTELTEKEIEYTNTAWSSRPRKRHRPCGRGRQGLPSRGSRRQRRQ